jgi:hypothetical protein
LQLKPGTLDRPAEQSVTARVGRAGPNPERRGWSHKTLVPEFEPEFEPPAHPCSRDNVEPRQVFCPRIRAIVLHLADQDVDAHSNCCPTCRWQLPKKKARIGLAWNPPFLRGENGVYCPNPFIPCYERIFTEQQAQLIGIPEAVK